ncbi:MAG TPA: aminotransferase class V-fold PLP-dependent enzyme [Gemmatimonadaceae bacterium]|nr:aminotransferase class V-fold PLP-dependent enzyme [Gemmatimonadaceae bacterium]
MTARTAQQPQRMASPKPTDLDVHGLRASEFPWALTGDATFLNAASTGPLPHRCIEAVTEWTRLRATPQKLSDEKLFATLARSRELVARLIGASPAEIALAVNTSYGINVAALGLPLEPGDVVITPDLEFPANIYPWWAAANARQLEYRRIPLSDGVLELDDLLRAMDDHRVKCVSVSWLDSGNGARVDLDRIGNACRERGIFFVVDAIQGVGAVPLDLHQLHVDILACGAQKWLLSPWGAGFVYVRDDLVRRLDPPIVSWMAPKGTDDFRRLRDYDMTWRDDARRFEFITLPFHDFAGMNASLELFFELGPDNVANHIEGLVNDIVEWTRDRRTVKLVTPSAPERRGGIACIRPPDGEKASARLKKRGIVHSLREGNIRLSPHMYNTRADVQAALEALDSSS